MGTSVSPSVNDSTDTSGPVKNSSITMWRPLSPKRPSRIIETTASFASSRLCAMMTPLPRASPSAFTTTGTGAVSR